MPNRLFIDEIMSVGLVDNPDNPDAQVAIYKRAFSTEQRVRLARQGKAIPQRNSEGEIVSGGYPIVTVGDLRNAIQAIGRAAAGERGKVMAHIKRRAKALGRSDLIPDTWKRNTTQGKMAAKSRPTVPGKETHMAALDLSAIEDDDLRKTIEDHVAEVEAERDDALAKLEEPEPEDVLKDAPPELVAKIEAAEARAAHAEEEVAKERDARVEKETRAAAEELPFVGSVDELQPIAKSEVWELVQPILERANQRLRESELFKTFGPAGDDEADYEARRDAWVAEYQKTHPDITTVQARAEFAKSAEGRRLREETRS